MHMKESIRNNLVRVRLSSYGRETGAYSNENEQRLQQPRVADQRD